MKYLISQGGCSSWAVMKWLNTPFPIRLNGFEYNAHCRDPNSITFLDKKSYIINKKISYSSEDIVLYILSNPFDYMIYCLNKPKNWILAHTNQVGSDYNYFKNKVKIDLKSYLEDPYDAFFYKEHTENYLNNDDRKYDLMFIKYESLKNIDILKDLKAFWGLSESHPDFKFKQRKSNWVNCSDDIKQMFNEKYGDMLIWYNNLPDYLIIKK